MRAGDAKIGGMGTGQFVAIAYQPQREGAARGGQRWMRIAARRHNNHLESSIGPRCERRATHLLVRGRPILRISTLTGGKEEAVLSGKWGGVSRWKAALMWSAKTASAPNWRDRGPRHRFLTTTTEYYDGSSASGKLPNFGVFSLWPLHPIHPPPIADRFRDVAGRQRIGLRQIRDRARDLEHAVIGAPTDSAARSPGAAARRLPRRAGNAGRFPAVSAARSACPGARSGWRGPSTRAWTTELDSPLAVSRKASAGMPGTSICRSMRSSSGPEMRLR